MATVVVELIHNRQQKEYQEVTEEEAGEVLRRPMAKGWKWVLPLWQWDEPGADPEVAREQRRQAYRRILGREPEEG